MATTADIPSVLIIDDRPDKLVVLEAVLSDLGLRIVTADSGRVGSEAFAARRIRGHPAGRADARHGWF